MWTRSRGAAELTTELAGALPRYPDELVVKDGLRPVAGIHGDIEDRPLRLSAELVAGVADPQTVEPCGEGRTEVLAEMFRQPIGGNLDTPGERADRQAFSAEYLLLRHESRQTTVDLGRFVAPDGEPSLVLGPDRSSHLLEHVGYPGQKPVTGEHPRGEDEMGHSVEQLQVEREGQTGHRQRENENPAARENGPHDT